MADVNYNGKTVSDENVKTILGKVAKEMDKNVIVVGGDRSAVPTGGSQTSHHLKKTAADFYIESLSVEEAFKKIQEKQKNIFDSDKAYQCIWHGNYTSTGGQHVHIGRYPDDEKHAAGVSFLKEGTTEANKGIYEVASGYASVPSARLAHLTNMSKLDASFIKGLVS